jgi:STE24 endopeptidase
MTDTGQASHYHRLRLWLAAVRLALTTTFFVAVLATGAARALADAAAAAVASPVAQVAIVAVVLGMAHAVLSLPLGFVGGFLLPRRFGLLHQPLWSWLADRAKAAALGGAVALAGVEALYALLRATSLWWLGTAALAFGFSIVVTAVLPVWVLPLFYRLAPLADESLRSRLLALAGRAGVPALGVWVADQSRKSRTANAAVVGLGRTRRILLYDTLTASFRPEEIEAVLAHELGHHVHGDMRRGLLVQGALSVIMFWLADQALRGGVAWWGLSNPADPAGLAWLALVLMGLGLVTAPLANAFSRFIERQADDFALGLTRNPGGFIGAMERLASLNLAERRPHRLKELMLYSHPALDRRIARAARRYRRRGHVCSSQPPPARQPQERSRRPRRLRRHLGAAGRARGLPRRLHERLRNIRLAPRASRPRLRGPGGDVGSCS